MKPSLPGTHKNRGFSLIEVLVVIVVMSVIAVSFVRMTASSQDEIANLRSKMGQIVLAEDIRFHASDSTLCRAALKTTTYASGNTTIPFEFDLGANRLVKSGADLRTTDNLMIQHFRLVNPTVVTSLNKLPLSSSGSTGTVVSAMMELVSTGGASGERDYKQLNVGRINLLVDGSNVIDCNNADLGGRTPASDGSDNPANSQSPCVTYAASSPNGAPPWVGKWPEYRNYACERFSYPMAGPQSMTVCRSTFQWTSGQYTNCGGMWAAVDAKMGPLGPFKTKDECNQASISDGMQFIQSTTSNSAGAYYSSSSTGVRTDICIDGKMLSFIDTDTDSDSVNGPAPADGS